MPNARLKHRRVVHKPTAGILKSIPEAVGLVGNPSQGLTNNTVAPPPSILNMKMDFIGPEIKTKIGQGTRRNLTTNSAAFE